MYEATTQESISQISSNTFRNAPTVGQKFKKSPGKKAREIKLIFFREIAFLAFLIFSQFKKLIFGHF